MSQWHYSEQGVADKPFTIIYTSIRSDLFHRTEPFSQISLLPGTKFPLGPWNFHSELLLHGTFAPQSILACEHSFSGAVVLVSICSLELSLPVTFAVLHSMRLLSATGGLIIVLNTVLYLIVVYALSSNSPVLFCLM